MSLWQAQLFREHTGDGMLGHCLKVKEDTERFVYTSDRLSVYWYTLRIIKCLL